MTPTYIDAVCDQLTQAVSDNDTAAVEQIVRRVQGDGHPELAERLLDQLIGAGLHNLANRLTGH